MGAWSRARGARWVGAVGAGAAIGISAYSQAAVGRTPTASGQAATVHSSASAQSISAEVSVSAIYCGRIGAHLYAGQRAGVELLGRYREDSVNVYALAFSGYYSYCSGHRPVYRAEFMAGDPNTGLLHFRPSGLRISPGDPLRVSVARTRTGVRLAIYDVNTKVRRTWTAPSLGSNAGWSAGALELFARPSGEPFLSGETPLLQLYSPTGGPANVPGPVPWAPIVFTHLTVNRHLVGRHTPGLVLTSWRVGASGSAAGAGAGTTGAHVLGIAAGTTPTNATVTPPTNGTFESHDGGLPPPVLGKNFDLTPVSGHVTIQVAGQHGFKRVPVGAQIPNGSEVDAEHGSVQMTLALPGGSYETGVFFDGQFQLHQNRRSGAVTATLTGGHGPKYCPVTAAGSGGAVTVAHTVEATAASGLSAASTGPIGSIASGKGKVKGKAGGNGKSGGSGKGAGKGNGTKVQSLWANAHGNFTTKGSGGAASVLGTKWYTENTCSGTYFRVVRDKIRVLAYYPHPHSVVVTAGHSYFAPNESAPIIQVSPVTSTGGSFNVRVTETYRLTVISPEQPAYVDAAVVPNLPGNGSTPLYRDGSVNGVPRWYVLFNITPNLIDFQYWNVGVKIGPTMYLVQLRVHG